MKRPDLTEAEQQRICELREEGVSVASIAAQVKCSVGSVAWCCLKLGADVPNPPPFSEQHFRHPVRRGNHVVRPFTQNDDRRLLELEAQGLGDSAIGRELKRRPNSIRGRLMTLARREEREATAADAAAALKVDPPTGRRAIDQLRR